MPSSRPRSATRGPRRVLGLALAATAAAGCATGYEVSRVAAPTVHPFAPAGAHATVCTLRPQWLAMAAPVVHKDNGHLVGLLRGANVYFCWRAQPGWHRFTAQRAYGWGGAQHGVARVDRYVRPGERVYLQLHLGFFGRDRLHPIAEGTARYLVGGMSYVVTRKWSRKMRPVHRGVVPAAGADANRSPTPSATSAPPSAQDTGVPPPPPPPSTP